MIRALGVSVLAFIFVAFVYNTFPTPVVYKTYPDLVCAWVDSNDPEHHCANLPPRYVTRYVSNQYHKKLILATPNKPKSKPF